MRARLLKQLSRDGALVSLPGKRDWPRADLQTTINYPLLLLAARTTSCLACWRRCCEGSSRVVAAGGAGCWPALPRSLASGAHAARQKTLGMTSC